MSGNTDVDRELGELEVARLAEYLLTQVVAASGLIGSQTLELRFRQGRFAKLYSHVELDEAAVERRRAGRAGGGRRNLGSRGSRAPMRFRSERLESGGAVDSALAAQAGEGLRQLLNVVGGHPHIPNLVGVPDLRLDVLPERTSRQLACHRREIAVNNGDRAAVVELHVYRKAPH